MSKSSLEAAAEAAAKVNAMLIAKGKLKLPQNQVKPKVGSFTGERIGEDLITTEIEINDAPVGARNLLTKGHTQDEICKYSGAAISTRGRYMTYEDKLDSSSERPLYLHVQASFKDSVDLAVTRVIEMISQFDKNAAMKLPIINNVVSSLSSNDSSSNTGLHFIQEKVFIGLEAPASFSIREKIIGPNASYLQHIKTETGANVTLRGRGSGFIEPTSGREAFEPLYIHLTHPKSDGLQAAKALALNLVDTVHSEYSLWQQQHQPLVPVNLAQPQISFQVMSMQPVASVAQLIHPSVSMSPMIHQQVSLPTYTEVSSSPLVTPIHSSSQNILSSRSPMISSGGYAPVFVSSSLPIDPGSAIGNFTYQTAVNVPTSYNTQLMNGGAPTMMLSHETSSATHNIMHPALGHHQPIMSPQELPRFNPLTREMVTSPTLAQNFDPAAHFNPFLQHPNHSVSRQTLLASNPGLLAHHRPPLPLINNEIVTSYPHLAYDKPHLAYDKPLNRDSMSSNLSINHANMSSHKRKFTEEPDYIPRERNHRMEHMGANRLQDQLIQQHSLGMMHTPNSSFGNTRTYVTGKDRVLMPPPMARNSAREIGVDKFVRQQHFENDYESKRQRGALGGLAMYYGSDDSDDEVTAASPVSPLKHYM